MAVRRARYALTHERQRRDDQRVPVPEIVVRRHLAALGHHDGQAELRGQLIHPLADE